MAVEIVSCYQFPQALDSMPVVYYKVMHHQSMFEYQTSRRQQLL